MNKEEILQEAIRRYPIGTIFNSAANPSSKNMEVLHTPKWSDYGNIGTQDDGVNGVVYDDGEWAEIVSLPVGYKQFFTIKDLADGKCVLINDGTKEELKAVLQAAYPQTWVEGISKYYWTADNYYWKNRSDLSYIESLQLPTQSVKEFIKQINMEKEIIGYKLKPNCEKYRSAALKIAGTERFLNSKKYDFMCDSMSYRELNKMGILDIWFEPVYEEIKTLPKINGYDGEKFNYDTVKYGCAELSVPVLSKLLSVEKLSSNRTIKSIKLSSGVEVTIEQIKQIVEYYN